MQRRISNQSMKCPSELIGPWLMSLLHRLSYAISPLHPSSSLTIFLLVELLNWQIFWNLVSKLGHGPFSWRYYALVSQGKWGVLADLPASVQSCQGSASYSFMISGTLFFSFSIIPNLIVMVISACLLVFQGRDFSMGLGIAAIVHIGYTQKPVFCCYSD